MFAGEGAAEDASEELGLPRQPEGGSLVGALREGEGRVQAVSQSVSMVPLL